MGNEVVMGITRDKEARIETLSVEATAQFGEMATDTVWYQSPIVVIASTNAKPIAVIISLYVKPTSEKLAYI